MFTFSFDVAAIFQLLFYVALLVFVIHAVVVAYHWISYGADRKRSWLGIGIHLTAGSILLLIMAMTLLYI